MSSRGGHQQSDARGGKEFRRRDCVGGLELGDQLVGQCGGSVLAARLLAGCEIARNSGSGSELVQIDGDLRRAEQAGPEEVEVCPAIHLSLDELELGVLPLSLAVRPGLGQRGLHGGTVLNDALCE